MTLRRIAIGRFCTSVLALFSLLPVGAHAAPGGDANAGADVFAQECSDCHSVKAGKNKKGPSLFGVVGRKSGSVADFSYSEAMLASGILWTADKIDAYVANPKATVPGNKMKYDGLGDAKAREDLLAFLAAQK